MPKKSKKRKELGRDELLDTGELVDRYRPLKQFLESTWGRIGLELQRVHNPDEVGRILKLVPGVEWCQPFRREKHLGCLLKEGSARVGWREVRLIRQHYENAIKSEHQLSSELYPARQKAEDATNALSVLISRFVRGPQWFEFFLVVAIAAKELGVADLRSHADHIQVAFLEASKQQQAFNDELSTQSGCFARREIVDFVQSQRHAVIPRNLAKAMAGLPDYGWIQSFRRLESVKDESPPTCDYQLFELLRSIVQKMKRLNLDNIEKKLREKLLHVDCDPILRSHVKPKWGYMKEAFAEHRGTRFTRRDLPYRIMGSYLDSIVRPKTLAEIELAKRSELS
jgi:hypothetical protein